MRMIPGEPEEDWSFWQFHAGGSVPGIVGDVDLDVFRYPRDALDSL
jgi:GH25 family lysozyme M1 (1,4-beta-N-acetylmuramidase)